MYKVALYLHDHKTVVASWESINFESLAQKSSSHLAQLVKVISHSDG